MPYHVFSRQEYEGRLTRVRDAMREQGFDCLYLPYGPNQFYVTGLHAQPTSQAASRVLAALVSVDEVVLFVAPHRRRGFVEKASWVSEIRTWNYPDDPADMVVAALHELGVDRGVVGFDPATPFQDVASIKRLLPDAELAVCSELFGRLRLVKSDEEIAHLRQAGAMADAATQVGLTLAKAGATEAEVAGGVYGSLLGNGGDVSLVAVIAGTHTGFPEKTGRSHVRRNELVMIFPKFSSNGYYCDITRMAIDGEPSDEERSIEEAVVEAHAAAVAVAKPGVAYGEVDKAARDVLERYGFAKYFTHGIGHGVGLETHEPPYVETNDTLEEGMVFTIEPSVYRPGKPAVRVEDTFVVTADGCEQLTRLPIQFFRGQP